VKTLATFLDPRVAKRIVALGVPLLGGQISFYLKEVADAAMVGRLGPVELGAIGVAIMFTGIMFVVIWPVSVGTQALASRRYGVERATGDEESAGLTGASVDNALAVGIVAGVLALLVSFAARPLFGLILENESVARTAGTYVEVMRFGIPFLVIEMAFLGFYSGINRTGAIMVSNVASNVVNVAVSYVLIFGKLGVPALGVRGAAIGTVVSQVLAAGYLVAVSAAPALRLRYRYLQFERVRRTTMAAIARAALPISIQNGIALTVFLSYQAMVGTLSTVHLAVIHLVFSLFRINKTIVGGFARAAAILVGNALGTGDTESAERYVRTQAAIGLLVGVAIMLAVLAAPRLVTSFFTNDPETIDLGAQALRFFAVFFFVEVLGYSFEIIFGGNGWGRFVLASEFSSNVVFILGLTALLLFVFELGTYGAWSGFAAYQLAHAAFLTAGYLSGRWKHVELERDPG
jgi:putative MATE family efflux protein